MAKETRITADSNPPHLYLALRWGNLTGISPSLYYQKTRDPLLSFIVVCVILCLSILVELWLVSDGHRATAYTALTQHRTVKMYWQKLMEQKHTFSSQKNCTTTQNKQKQLKPGLDASYDIQPENGHGLFWFWCVINLSLTYLLT